MEERVSYMGDGADEEARRHEMARQAGLGPLFNAQTERGLEILGAEIDLDLQGKTVFIMGPGVGSEVPIYLAQGAARVMGLDRDERATEVARQQFVDSVVDLRVGNLVNLGDFFESGSVDAITSRLVWQHLPIINHSEIMRGCRAGLKKGGICFWEEFRNIAKTWGLEPFCSDFEWLKQKFVEIYPNVGADGNIGISLVELSEAAGLRVIGSREDQVESKGNPVLEAQHIQIMEKAIRAMGALKARMGIEIAPPEELAEKMARFEAYVKERDVNLITPVMVQVLAVRDS